jgi:hypothetical protein
MKVLQRRQSYFVLAGLVALAIGVSQAVAGSHHHLNVNFNSLKNTCDNGTTGSNVGFVDVAYKSDKHKLTVQPKIRGLASTTYTFYVLDANTCTQIGGAIGTLDTKPNGKGSAKFVVDVTGYGHKFVVNANDGANDNYTAVANLG